MILELDQEVTLTRDLPEHELHAGDTATLIDTIPNSIGSEQDCILEIFDQLGETPSVVTVPISAVKPLRLDEVLIMRSFVQT